MQNNESKECSKMLRKCPFCGGEAIIYEDKENSCYMIGCRECCAVEPMTEWCESKENAIAQWNTRKPLERIVERLNKYEKHYSNQSEKWSDKNCDIYASGCANRADGILKAIEIVSEEGGMND